MPHQATSTTCNAVIDAAQVALSSFANEKDPQKSANSAKNQPEIAPNSLERS